ncbi:helix-turn-helix transcriptional regulator [Streptomyces sp. NBC_00715]|uniref:helix-turn-helix domain-containing protein n=1 Tax=Streptomyces sp. NBC_00715 TaxID=2975811 RepID=UPI0038633544
MQIRRDLPSLAERRALRQAAGLSTSELAKAIGVSKQAVTSWENGTRNPRGIHLDRYVDALRALRDEIAKAA